MNVHWPSGAEKGYLETRKKCLRVSGRGFLSRKMQRRPYQNPAALSDSIKLGFLKNAGGAGKDRSAFMDIYSAFCRWHMQRYERPRNK